MNQARIWEYRILTSEKPQEYYYDLFNPPHIRFLRWLVSCMVHQTCNAGHIVTGVASLLGKLAKESRVLDDTTNPNYH